MLTDYSERLAEAQKQAFDNLKMTPEQRHYFDTASRYTNVDPHTILLLVYLFSSFPYEVKE